MAEKKSGFVFKWYYIAVLFLIVLIAVMLLSPRPQTQTTNIQAVTPTISPETALLVDVAVWYPSAPWTEPKTTSQETMYGTLPGEGMQASITSPTASIDHFEETDTLAGKGFLPDVNLQADGPGSSTWGYKKSENGMTQIMTFSYRTQPSNTNPNEPIQFTCPCTVDVAVFVSNPFSEK